MKRCLTCEATFRDADWRCPTCGAHPAMVDGIPAFAPAMAFSDDNFATEIYRQIHDIAPGHFWFRTRNEIVAWSLRRYFPNACSYLEVGCGSGLVLAMMEKAFPDLTTAGGDLSIDGLRFAQTRVTRSPLYQIDGTRIPFYEEFDLIGSYDMVEHVPDDQAALRSMRDALKPGGGLILMAPQHPFLWNEFDDYNRHVRRYASGELAAKAKDAGFTILRQTSFISLLLPAMLLSRLMRKGHPVVSAVDEVAIGPVANSIGVGFSKVENLLIKSGFRFPLGGSALVIAQKER